MRRLTCAIATAFCLLLASAHAAAAKDNWLSLRSRNFYLVGNAPEKEIRRVATRLEQFRDVFSRLFPAAKFNSPVPTTVVVFKSDNSYKPFKPVVDGRVSEVAGYFQPGEAVNYITLTTEARGENPFAIIYHEYVHLLVENSVGGRNMPPWLNEGLAEYYSTFDVDDDRKVLLGGLINSHIFLLRQRPLVPLKTLFETDNYSLHRNRREAKGVFYAQSWALVHYLILGANGQRLPQLGRFLALVTGDTPVERAFAEAFQTDFAGMEKELKKYVEAHTFRTQLATFDRKLELDSEFRAAPLSEAEAEAVLGDLLLNTNRPEDAVARLEQAVRLDPKLAAAHASLGMARARQKRFDEARKHLRDALAADPDNYLIHYYYASALSREGMDEGGSASGYTSEAAREIRGALRRAAELKPDFPETYRLLAWVSLVTGEGVGEGIEYAKKALALSPGNERYAFVLAQLYLRDRDFASARQVAESLARQGGDPRMRDSAQSLLRSIDTAQQQAARYKEAREAARREGRGGQPEGHDGERPRLKRLDAERPAAEAGENAGKTEEQLVADALNEAINGALRPPAAGEARAQGLLVRIECSQKGIVFHLKAGGRVLKLHAESFNDLHIMAYTREAGDQITCGERKPESHVVVTYRPAADAKTKPDGALLAVEFVPANFRLKQ
ncbi:MAG TPA: tetratricopeptide repeat protein [Pyrinomonadaceae bacterium]|nr:tetratricopeptide repeat protein [Pyrinomonadaceae bacterium]